jgi:hypothetical protein
MDIGRIFIILGIVLLIAGLLFTLFPLGGFPRLPGDIYIKRDNFVFYFPIVTSILISLILSLILHFFVRK